MSKRFWFKLLSVVVTLSFTLSACKSTSTPVPPEKVVVTQEVVVTQQVEVTKQVVVTEQVEVTKQVMVTQNVVVTATPVPTQNPYDENAPLKVWVDAERSRSVDLFLQAYPEYKDKIQIVTDDRGTFIQKLLLYNNVGSNWPDVTFIEPPNIRLSATKQYDKFPMDLRDWIPADVISKFATGSMDPCTLPDGTIICLRNDIAPYVLFYNAPKMKEWGYTIPTTWEEYYALAQKVATEHPKTIVGQMNSYAAEQEWFANSQCPMLTPVDPTTYRVNLSHPNCQRVVKLLDDLDKLGVMWKLAPWDASIYTMFGNDGWLMWNGPIWEAGFLFPGYLGDAGNGKVGVAAFPKWADQDRIYSGSGGGGAWVMSRHTKNPMLAAKLITFVTTDLGVIKQAPTLTAYQPNQQAWITEKFATLPLWATGTDAAGVAQTMAGTIWNGIMDGPPIVGNVLYPLWDKVISGEKTVADIFPDLQKGLEAEVTKSGYNVVTTGP